MQIRAGDVPVVLPLDRLGRTMRETLNLVHKITDRGGTAPALGYVRVADELRHCEDSHARTGTRRLGHERHPWCR